MKARSIILVTGSHRSGTTWVGKTLNRAPETTYLHEPFNRYMPLTEYTRFRADHNYMHLTRLNSRPFEADLDRLLNGKFWRPAPPVTSVGSAVRWPRRWWLANRPRRRGYHVILKDPMALLAAEYLAERYAAKPVVMIRHPAAFVASLVVKGWHFEFYHLAHQPHAVYSLFPEDADDVFRLAREPASLVEQGAVLWRVLHRVIRRYREDHPNWHFVRHEDVSRDPIPEFRRMTDYAGLTWDDKIEQAVQQSTGAAFDPNARGQVRDSKKNITTWKQRLADDDIDAVRRTVGDVADAFYGADDW
ncbi:MAG: sulfotransferase [Planctomycetota bacterium]